MPVPATVSMRMAVVMTVTVMLTTVTTIMRTMMDSMRLWTVKVRLLLLLLLEASRALLEIFMLMIGIAGVVFLETVLEFVVAAMRLWARVERFVPRLPRVLVLN